MQSEQLKWRFTEMLLVFEAKCLTISEFQSQSQTLYSHKRIYLAYTQNLSERNNVISAFGNSISNYTLSYNHSVCLCKILDWFWGNC